MNPFDSIRRRTTVACQTIAAVAALLGPGAASAQIGISRAEASTKFGLQPLLDRDKQPVRKEGLDCYETTAAGDGVRFCFLVDRDRVVGVTIHPDRYSTRNEDFQIAMTSFCSHVLDGKPKQSTWEWVADLTAPFPPVGNSWERVIPEMRTLYYQKTIYYNRLTGRVLLEMPWMPVSQLTGRYDVNRGREYYGFTAYSSADRKLYAAVSFGASEGGLSVLDKSPGPRCSGFLIATSEVFWKHLCRAAANRILDLVHVYDYELQDYLRKTWREEFNKTHKVKELPPESSVEERKKQNAEESDLYDKFEAPKRVEVVRQRTSGVLRAAVDRGHWESDGLAAELKSINDEKWASGASRYPGVTAAFCELLTRDIHRIDGERAKRRCLVLGELAEAKDLAALQTIAAGAAAAEAAARAACRRIAERFKIAGCPADRAGDAQWKTWLTTVTGAAKLQPQ